MDTELKSFEIYLARRGLKPGTIYRHLLNIKRLSKKAVDFNPESLENYFFGLIKKGFKASYVNLYICSVFVWADFKNLPELKKIKPFPEQAVIKSTMSDDEIESFLSLPAPKGRGCNPIGYNRWTLFFKICAFTGMRTGEVANLTVNDVQLGLGAFVVRESKTKQPRMIPIPSNVVDDLPGLLQQAKDGFIFWSVQGGTGGIQKGGNPVFSDVQWNYQFKVRLERLGIKRQGLTPYSLRHSFITRMLEEDVNLFKVQKIVGHRQISTTASYTHLTMKDTQNAIRKHPLIRKHEDPKFVLQLLAEYIRSLDLNKNDKFGYSITDTEVKVWIK